MMKVVDKAKFIRSKNAGPFWVTMDIFTDSKENYEAIVKSPNFTVCKLAKALNTDPKTLKLFCLDDLGIVKVSIPREAPQGSKYERDMHAGQQYIPLEEFEL